MQQICIKCSGTGTKSDGTVCDCKAGENRVNKMRSKFYPNIPQQYQNVDFDKVFLPDSISKDYGAYMESLLKDIALNSNLFQKNILICNKPNTGKTIWAYSLISRLWDNGIDTPPVMDLLETRDILWGRSQEEGSIDKILRSRCLVVKIPADLQYWMIDNIVNLIDRRVANNGFTIFIFNGSWQNILDVDKKGLLSNIKGSGQWHTIKVEDFT